MLLNILITSKEIAQEFRDSKMNVDNVDYIASRMTRAEIVKEKLQKLIPGRKFTRGAAPGGNTKENIVRLNVAAEAFMNENGVESIRDTKPRPGAPPGGSDKIAPEASTWSGPPGTTTAGPGDRVRGGFTL